MKKEQTNCGNMYTFKLGKYDIIFAENVAKKKNIAVRNTFRKHGFFSMDIFGHGFLVGQKVK